MHGTRHRIWLAYVAASVLVGSLYLLVPATPLTKLVLYNGLGLSAVVAILVGVRLHRPAHRLPWYLFAIGQASFLTADLIYYFSEKLLDAGAPFPGPADLFYLCMYPMVMAGLLLVTRRMLPGRDGASIIDASIIAIALFVLSWVTIMDTYVVEEGLSLPVRVVSLAYPVMDVLLLAVTARLVSVARTKAPSFFLIGGSVLALLTADTLYGFAQLSGGYVTGGPIDAGWMLFYVLFGAAALHPSMRKLATVDAGELPGLTRKRVAVLTLATTMVPLADLLIVRNEMVDAVVTTFGSVALFMLVLARVLGLVRNVEQGQQRLQHEARHDSLTDLGNRVMFAEQVELALAGDSATDMVAVMFIDLDDFKTVNDSLGHQAGDDLLVIVAERLLGCLAPGDVAARLGGDEFAVLLTHVRTQMDAGFVAERLQVALNEPLTLQGREVRVAGSVGIAVQSRADGDVQSLLRSADVAMYLAKSKGKGRYEFFEDSMYDQVVERLELKADLQSAISRGQLELVYQPIVDLTGGIVGCEALLRWHHPDRGTVPPDVFIPLAEETGLIVPIGRWVLQEACCEAKKWQGTPEHPTPVGVSINLSVRQLHDAGLVDDVAEALRVSGLDPRMVTLEVTESTLMVDTELGAARLQRLKQLHVRVAIDDFGTGYSSLTYLQRFPVDSIKIDRAFVRELGRADTNSSALVRSVVDLASALSMTTVAEGVEDAEQLAALNELQCGLGQGYYFARPQNADAVTSLLRSQSARSLGHTATGSTELQVLTGLPALHSAAEELERFHALLGVPLTSRGAWLCTWAASFPAYEPLTVIIRGSTGEIAGAALLAVRRGADFTSVVPLGDGGGGATVVAAFPGAVDALADGIVEALTGLGTPWTLNLGQIEADAPTVAALAARLDGAQVLPELRVPRVALSGDQPVTAYLSRNTRRTLKRARNRVAAEGLTMATALLTDPLQILTTLPEVERVHRERDHATGRGSDLDCHEYEQFWRSCLTQLAESGQLEVHTLRLNGALAAYVVCVVDGDTYRVLDGRFDTAYADYSPGRLLEAAALDRALGDGRFTVLDWMSGVGAEKILTYNDGQERCRLVAESEPDAELAALLGAERVSD